MRTKTRGKRGVFGFGFLLEPNGYLMVLVNRVESPYSSFR